MTTFLAIAAFLLFAVGGALLVGAFVLWHPVSAQVQKRVNALARDAAFAGHKKVEAASLPSAGMNLFVRFFTLGMPRTWGIGSTPTTLLLLGLVAGGAVWPLSHLMFGLPPLAALPLMTLAFWCAPNFLARLEQGNADKHFLELFPDAIDMIVRMLRASLPVSGAIRTVGDEAPEPINRVFTDLADQIEIGISFEDALGIGSERIGLPDFRFFAAAVALQHSTGGNLVTTLEILGDIIRRRRTVRMKAQAATAEVRMSAYLLSGLPFIVIGALAIISPAYMKPLITDPRGNYILLMVVIMLTLAFVSMRYMMRSAIRM